MPLRAHGLHVRRSVQVPVFREDSRKKSISNSGKLKTKKKENKEKQTNQGNQSKETKATMATKFLAG